MATLIVAELTDHIADALDTARDQAAGDRRWCEALETAASWLLEQETLAYDEARHELTVPSPNGRTYYANGSCQCKAFTYSHACWHRAAARLVQRALELRGQRAANAARRLGLEPLHEVEALADEIHATEGGAWIEARQKAEAQMPELLDLAAAWNAAAVIGTRLARARAVAAELFA